MAMLTRGVQAPARQAARGGFQPSLEALENRWVPVFIDNGLAPDSVGYFGIDVGDGGNGISSSVTAQGNTTLITEGQWIFDYFQYVDVGSDGNAVTLQSTTVTTPAFLDTDGSVVSQGTFAGANGDINWEARTSIAPNGDTVFTEVTFTSASALGDLQVISYLDEDVGGVSDDILAPSGTAGASNFQAFTLDNPERVGFSQGGIYSDGTQQVNANYDGWAADSFSNLRSDITGGGTTYTIDGNINTTNLPPFDDPDLGTVYGPADITTAFAWSVDETANTATVTTFLRLLSTDPSQDVDSITLEPDFQQRCTDQTATITATVLDFAGDPVFGATVDFTITGANPQTVSLTTNIFGQAVLNYTGTNPGFDVITATSGNADATAIVEWIEDPIVSSLSGQVFIDFNNDGIRQPGEPGLADTPITISGNTFICPFETVVTSTDENGNFTVNLPAGVYNITIQQPAAYIPGQTIVGTAGGTMVNTSTIVDISLPAFTDGVNYNFGFLGLRPEFVSKRFFFASTTNDIIPGNITLPEQTASVDLTGADPTATVSTQFLGYTETRTAPPVNASTPVDDAGTTNITTTETTTDTSTTTERRRRLGENEVDEVWAEYEEDEDSEIDDVAELLP
ncbi:Ig-like domain-containing protein [Planctomycetes bacterium Pan216]